MRHDTWVSSDGNLYYMRSWGGALNTGWMQLDGERYYFDKESCAAYANTIQKIDQDIYGFDENGRMLHDCWVDADGVHYYFRGWGGAMHDQTAVIDGKEYVFDSDGNGVEKTEEPADVEAESITITGAEEPFVLTVGETMQLEINILPENTTDKTVTWSVDDPAVVSMNEEGMLTGAAEGTATVTVQTANGLTATAVVNVIGEADEDTPDEGTDVPDADIPDESTEAPDGDAPDESGAAEGTEVSGETGEAQESEDAGADGTPEVTGEVQGAK